MLTVPTTVPASKEGVSVPFMLYLPLEVPSSVVTQNGSVEYTVEAAVQKSGLLKSEKRLAERIDVVSHVDLNRVPGAAVSVLQRISL